MTGAGRGFVAWGMGGAVAALLLAALSGCAETVAPGASDYRPTSFRSRVTVTGNDIPGPLRLREVRLGFAEGGGGVPLHGRVAAEFRARIAGHGELVGRWERDGEVVDRVRVFITYGDDLRVTLADPAALPTDASGRHEVRFVVEKPEDAPEGPPPITYEVAARFG